VVVFDRRGSGLTEAQQRRGRRPARGDFELIGRQTSGATKSVGADELTWFALEVVEWRARRAHRRMRLPFDAGLTDKVDVTLTGTTSPLALSDAQALRCMVLKLTGTHPGGAYQVHCPTNKKIYVVWNSTAGNVIFKTVAGTGIVVNAGAVLILYCDGANVIQLAGLVATIDDIGDVVITAAASGQMLRFNGSNWSTRTVLTTSACSSRAATATAPSFPRWCSPARSASPTTLPAHAPMPG
jgi:hypothetical protein